MLAALDVYCIIQTCYWSVLLIVFLPVQAKALSNGYASLSGFSSALAQLHATSDQPGSPYFGSSIIPVALVDW